MKRYWKVLLICIATSLIIGSFYIQSSLAANDYAKFTIETVSGDEEEASKIVLHADYVLANMYQYLQISKEDTINVDSLSFFQRLKRGYSLPVYSDLMERHKSFMRGKELHLSNFYENEEFLAYANIYGDDFYSAKSESFLEIEVLEKESNERSSVELVVPDREKYSWLDVMGLQVVNEQLKVFVRAALPQGEENVLVYTFEVDGLELVDTEDILTTTSTKKSSSFIRMLNEYNPKGSQNYLILLNEIHVHEWNENNEQTMRQTEVFVYDVENNQVEELEIPSEMFGSLNTAIIDRNTLYIPNRISESSYEVISYDLEKKVWGNKRTFSIPDDTSVYMELIAGKIYFVYPVEDGYAISVGDLNTGDSFFEGKMKMKNQKANESDYRLYIRDLERY